ncbi:MAG: sigma-54-dependent Fis family transcriptional regulator, partial [Myxococcales bacterium]|nr:sigma-54-dependent Fis family transcriptional regulator [Myxococcales bacterium]
LRVERVARAERATQLLQLHALAAYDLLESPVQRLHALTGLEKVGPTTAPILVNGESGTGKELIAEAVHKNSDRADHPFISENCAALTETLLESELFGYVKGAFTGAERDRKGLFEQAHGGTLFLDEVGDMSQGMQRKLLRVLQEGEVRPVGGVEPVNVDVRIVSASNRDLREMVGQGEFREDLYYRLRVLQIRMPPLRERREDVALLVSHFLDREARRQGGKPIRLAPGVVDQLMAYDWPGNVRELENECMRMVALSGEVVESEVLSDQIRTHVPVPIPAGPPDEVRDLNALIEQIEVAEIEKALALFDYNKTKAAEALCISRFALQRKMEKYGIDAQG